MLLRRNGELGIGRKDRSTLTLATHLGALHAVGLTETDVPWQLLGTVLLLARRPA